MVKKCIVCGKEAKFCVKGCAECYCDDCAKEYFNDMSYLQKVEEQAKNLKKLIEEKVNE